MKISAVRMTVLRMRERFGVLLRQHIAETVASPSEVEEEIDYIIKLFQRPD